MDFSSFLSSISGNSPSSYGGSGAEPSAAWDSAQTPERSIWDIGKQYAPTSLGGYGMDPFGRSPEQLQAAEQQRKLYQPPPLTQQPQYQVQASPMMQLPQFRVNFTPQSVAPRVTQYSGGASMPAFGGQLGVQGQYTQTPSAWNARPQYGAMANYTRPY